MERHNKNKSQIYKKYLKIYGTRYFKSDNKILFINGKPKLIID